MKLDRFPGGSLADGNAPLTFRGAITTTEATFVRVQPSGIDETVWKTYAGSERRPSDATDPDKFWW